MSLDLTAAEFAARFQQRGDDWLDLTDGARVRVHPEPRQTSAAAFVGQEAKETAARIAAGLNSPWVLTVRCVSPRVVCDAPPEAARPQAALPLPEAAECLLQLCDVLARAHALGWAGLFIEQQDVQVSRGPDGPRLTVLIPSLPPQRKWSWVKRTVAEDLHSAAVVFRDLLLGREPQSTYGWKEPIALGAFRFKLRGHAAARDVLLRLLADRDGKGLPDLSDAAALAAQVAPLARDAAGWKARAAALPAVKVVQLKLDVERLVQLGEAAWATDREDPFTRYSLCASLHQRAVVAHARGDAAGALRDLERALEVDRWPRALVTRGVVRGSQGDWAGAIADCDAAVQALKRETPGPDDEPYNTWRREAHAERDAARALYVRGVGRLHTGALPGAIADLEEASGLSSSVQLSAADFEKPVRIAGTLASELAQRSRQALRTAYRTQLAATPDDAELRLRHARNLAALGRDDDARAEAKSLSALRPGDEAWQKRLARLLA